ncbi:MAG: glycosyltransferase family 1 protein [Magnetococcales bacterium]|nr:glycosyltransferase family 1 protein [Magnetococcales bacterium]
MRVLVITAGLYEYFYSLQTELLLLGYEVYVLHLEPMYLESSEQIQKERLQGEDCDLVITANIFDAASKPRILDILARFNITSPIISIAWGHPVEEIETLWQKYDSVYTNSIIKELKILFWSPCEKATQEYLALGFDSIVYAPFGFSDKMQTFPFFCWKTPEQACTKSYLDLIKDTTPEIEIDISNSKIIYMGVLPAKPENVDPQIDILARNLAEISVADPTISRADMKDMWSHIFSKIPTERPGTFFKIAETFKYYHARGTRRVFVHRLKKEFGDHFLLFGDDWIADNLVAEPTQTLRTRGVMYHHIPIAVDLGSVSFETCFFPRPIEIVKNMGCLLSYRRYDSDRIFQQNADSLVFDTPDELCNKVDFLLSNEQERNDCRHKILNTFNQQHGMVNSLKKVIDKAVKLYF